MAKGKKRTNEPVIPSVSGSSKPRRNASAEATANNIGRLAYNLCLARGREHGHDVDHWLRAERELRNRPASITV